MFAVPGWSLESSALKSQTQPVQPKNESQPAKDASTPDGKNNKRKRANVTAGNVDEMYRKHIEGSARAPKDGNPETDGFMKPEKKQKKEKKQKQKQKEEKEAIETSKPEEPTAEAASVEADADQAEDKVPKKKQKRNKKNKDKANASEDTAEADSTTTALKQAAPAISVPALPPTSNLTPLQQAMRQKLISSRFRHLNEQLYTTPSEKAVELFNANPELFDEYHAGFARQVKESWPSNPVDGYIKTIRTRGAIPLPKRGKPNNPAKGYPLPRRPTGLCTIADLGCGDGQIARSLTPSAKKLNIKFHSYDLQSPDPLITKADISNLPLEDGSVDVAIFCLSLMGTNWVSFVEEAWRVLRGDGKGECWVSEVKSRFGKVTRKKSQIGAQRPGSKPDKKKSKKKSGDESDVEEGDIFAEDAQPADKSDETDISAFVEVFRSRGFMLRQESVDKSNKMFVRMVFVKQGGAPTKGKHASALSAPASGSKKRFVDRKPESEAGMSAEQEAPVLKPCVYKIR